MSGGGARGRGQPAGAGGGRRSETAGRGKCVRGEECMKEAGSGNGSVRISSPRHLHLAPQPSREGAKLSGEGSGTGAAAEPLKWCVSRSNMAPCAD